MSAPIAASADRARLQAAARQLETLVLEQLIQATRAFTGGDGAGSAIRADLFADALADALVKGGGIGLARQIEESLSGRASSGFDSHLTRHEGVDLGVRLGENPVDTARALKKYALRADGVIDSGS